MSSAEDVGMELECVFFGPFRDAVGEKTVRHETDVATVGELLAEFESTYPALEGELLAGDGDGDGDDDRRGDGLAGDTVVTRDDRNVTHIDGLETELADGDVVRLVPSVYGG